MATVKGADLCEKYFYSTFDDLTDRSVFQLKYESLERLTGPRLIDRHYFGARASFAILEKWDDPFPSSFPSSLHSTQLMPAEVMIQSVEPRKGLYKNPHYFILKWTKKDKLIAVLRVDPRPDGTHPLAKMHNVNGAMTISLS